MLWGILDLHFIVNDYLVGAEVFSITYDDLKDEAYEDNQLEVSSDHLDTGHLA